MSQFKDSDKVNIIILFKGNHLWWKGLTRIEASDILRSWYGHLENKRQGNQESIDYLDKQACALNYKTQEGSDVCDGVFLWRDVIAMYVARCETPPQQELLNIQKDLVNYLKEESSKGEEWRDGNNTDE